MGALNKIQIPYRKYLSARRHHQKMYFMNKVNYGKVPSIIVDLLFPLVCEISVYPLRNNNNFSTTFTHTNVSSKSCIPSVIRMWNSLDKGLENLPTITVLCLSMWSPPHEHVGERGKEYSTFIYILFLGHLNAFLWSLRIS